MRSTAMVRIPEASRPVPAAVNQSALNMMLDGVAPLEETTCRPGHANRSVALLSWLATASSEIAPRTKTMMR